MGRQALALKYDLSTHFRRGLIQSSFVGGFAGHGVVPARPDDVFGIGYYFYNLSDDLQDATAPVFPFDDESGIEVY